MEVLFTWSQPAQFADGEPLGIANLESYEIGIGVSAGDRDFLRVPFPPDQTVGTVTGVDPGTYTVAIRAKSLGQAGEYVGAWSLWSNETDFTLELPARAPAAPINLTAVRL